MKRDSYSDQQAHASFQPRSPQSAIDPTQLGQPVHHSSSTRDLGTNWLNKASRWVADKFQTAQTFVNSINSSGDAIAPDQILPALRGTANRSLSQSAQSDQPLVGVIDSGFGADEHGSKMVEAIQKENPQAKIWRGGGVGTGGGLEALVEFVDVAKATGQSRAVANLSFDLTEVHPDGSISTRTQLTAEEQSALAYARDNGVLVVASAGNQGGAMSALGQASQPFDNLIVVGAANGSDRASYSSYGKGLDLVADVGAAGTSLAAAKTTGAIAKLWSANPELSSQQVNQMLTATATDLKAPGWDAETGVGLLNSTGAIDLATQTTPEPIVFSGAQLVRQDSGLDEASSFKSRAWTSIDGAIASERPNWDLFGGIAAAARDIVGIADAEPAAQTPFERHREMERVPLPPQPISAQQAFERHREMERAPLPPQPTSAQRAALIAPEPNPPDSAAMEQPNSTPGQVAIQQGDTLWKIAQEQLGSGDRWRELRKPDGSPFTEQEASQLQVGTSVQIPGAQPNPIGTPPQPPPASALNLDEVIAKLEQTAPAPNPLDEAIAREEREAGQKAFERHREMERDLSVQISDIQPDRTNPLDVAASAPPPHNPLDLTENAVVIQQDDTLWDIAQEQLGSGDRWRELRKPDGSPFTEQEASQLQVGTSVQIPGAQPDPSAQEAFALHRQGERAAAQSTSGQRAFERHREMERAPLPPPPPAPPPPAPAPNDPTDFVDSVVNKVWEAGEGVVETVTNPGQAVNDLVNSVHTIVTDPGQAWDSFSKPYVDAFNSGRYWDLGGQLVGDALLAVSPGGLAVRFNNVLGNLPGAPPAPTPEIPSPSPTPTDLTPAIPSSNPIPTDPPSTPAPNPSDLPPPAPAPDSIASIPDDVGNALQVMGDGETLDTPSSSVPPAPQSGSLGDGGDIAPQNPLTDGGSSPPPSGLELADPSVSSPPAVDLDRQLVTVGARDLEQTSSSPDRSPADSRNYEPAAVGGGNGGTRPSDPPTAVPIPDSIPLNQNSRADAPPEPQSGNSGNSNLPPQDPPIGGGGSPSASDSEPDDPNVNRPSGQSNDPDELTEKIADQYSEELRRNPDLQKDLEDLQAQYKLAAELAKQAESLDYPDNMDAAFDSKTELDDAEKNRSILLSNLDAATPKGRLPNYLPSQGKLEVEELEEAYRLIEEGWSKGSKGREYNDKIHSAVDHFERKTKDGSLPRKNIHDILDYLQRASRFDKAKATRTFSKDEKGNEFAKWEKPDGEYIEESLDGKILTYGFNE